MIRLILLISTTIFHFFLNSQTVRQLSDFNSINTSGHVEVELIKSHELKIEIKMLKGDENELTTSISGGRLEVAIENNRWYRNSARAQVKVYYQSLNEISTEAGSRLYSSSKVENKTIELSSSSGSKLEIEVEAALLDVKATSGSKIVLSGNAKNGKFKASSGSIIKASNLSSTEVEAKSSTGSNLEVWAVESIEASSSTGGSIKYKGQPQNKNLESGDMTGGSIRSF